MGKIKKWTEEELSILKNNYEKEPNEKIEKMLNRSRDAIILKANQLKIKKNHVKSRLGDLSFLLKDEMVAYYWIGFIFADGYINHETKRLKITVSEKDFCVLEDFKNLCNFSGKIKYTEKLTNFGHSKTVSISIQDKKIISELIDKFDFKKSKTYNPPKNFNFLLKNDLFLSFLIGYIDGDGNISKQHKRKDCYIRIKVHKNWIFFISFLKKRLEEITKISTGEVKINKEGYCCWSISNFILIKKIKKFMLENNIKAMKRKWDVVDLNYINRTEKLII